MDRNGHFGGVYHRNLYDTGTYRKCIYALFHQKESQIWRTDLMPGSRCWDAQADMQTPKQYNASICHESKCILALVRPQKRSGLGAEGGRSDVKYMESLGDLGLNLQALDIKETLHVAFLASFPLRELGTAMDAFWSWDETCLCNLTWHVSKEIAR